MHGHTGSYAIYDIDTTLKVTTNGEEFYNLETDFFHNTSSKNLCVDLKDNIIVDNNYTHGAQCMRDLLIQVGGNLNFSQGAGGARHITEYFSTDIEMNGRGA